jgi:hypothetical protein
MSRPRLRKLLVRSIGLAVSTVLVAGLLIDLPPTRIPKALAAIEPAPAPGPPPAIPSLDRLPVPAYPEENVVLHPQEVEPIDLADEATPEDPFAGLEPLPELGGPNFDVYGTGPKAHPHVAAVFPEVVNFHASDGAWRDLPTEFEADPGGGWKADAVGATIRLPQTLSADDPVRLTFPGGTVRISPSHSIGTGTSDGPTITYVDGLPATDFVYTLNGGGYVEDIILKDASAEGTISYDLAAPGFELTLGADKRIELRRAGEGIATLGVPVAFDSSSPVATTIPSLVLHDLGAGNWQLDVSLDPAFVASATYPITIDPTLTTTVYATASGVHDDTYVDLANPGSSFADASLLSVSGARRRPRMPSCTSTRRPSSERGSSSTTTPRSPRASGAAAPARSSFTG